MNSLAGCPVVQDEPDADADHRHVDQRRHRGVGRRIARDDVGVRGERDAADGDDARREAVQAVDEIDRVDRRDDQYRGDRHRDTGAGGDQGAERQRYDLQAAPRHEHRDQQLPGHLQHPVQIPQVVGHAQQAYQHRAGEDHPLLVVVLEQSGRECDATGVDHCERESDQHAQSAHARRRDGVHVARTNLSDRADMDGDMANQRRDQPGDAACDGGDQQIYPHAPRPPPFMCTALRTTG